MVRKTEPAPLRAVGYAAASVQAAPLRIFGLLGKLGLFFAALKSLHPGKPQIDSRIPCLNARKPWGQSCPTADFTMPHSRFEHRHETGFVALILHAAMRGWQNQFHFQDVSDF